jgi:hypothetical protein
MPCTQDANPCADVKTHTSLRQPEEPTPLVSHCRRGDPKPTNTAVASLTSKPITFNVLSAQLRLGQRPDCQPLIRLSTRLPLTPIHDAKGTELRIPLRA